MRGELFAIHWDSQKIWCETTNRDVSSQKPSSLLCFFLDTYILVGKLIRSLLDEREIIDINCWFFPKWLLEVYILQTNGDVLRDTENEFVWFFMLNCNQWNGYPWHMKNKKKIQILIFKETDYGIRCVCCKALVYIYYFLSTVGTDWNVWMQVNRASPCF